jgi:hypothetical protein
MTRGMYADNCGRDLHARHPSHAPLVRSAVGLASRDLVGAADAIIVISSEPPRPRFPADRRRGRSRGGHAQSDHDRTHTPRRVYEASPP